MFSKQSCKNNKYLFILRNQTSVFDMRNIRFISVLLLFVVAFSSCSTGVDLYADYKDVPIIYALLDIRADTNYVKITRAFCGTNDNPIEASDVAMIYDSSNYPGKLDARVIELKSTHGGDFLPTGRELVLDTMTIHNKEAGTFYSPDQIIYYTTRRFISGTDGNRYKYKLVVVKPDGDTVTAQTGMVGNDEFRVLTNYVNFHTIHPDVVKISFIGDDMAAIYSVKIQFNYSEQHGNQEVEWKSISNSFGTKLVYEYASSADNVYYVTCPADWLFEELENAIGGDTIIDANHPNVIRHIGSFEIYISAGGQELGAYYASHQAQLNSPMSLVSVYTNIEGGYGMFSSRTNIKNEAELSYTAIREIFARTAWGFKEQ
jgi:hypothetical protein